MERAIIRFTKTSCYVICPKGHLLTSCQLGKDFAGSMFEAEVAFHATSPGDRFDRMASECKGHGHDK